MDKALEQTLRESLARRASQLARMAAESNCPTPVLTLFARNVLTTSMLLLGEKFAHDVFDKLLTCLRDSNGICLCGKAQMAEGKALCQACWDGLEAEDKAIEAEMKLHKRVDGKPS